MLSFKRLPIVKQDQTLAHTWHGVSDALNGLPPGCD